MVPFEALYGRKCRTLIGWDGMDNRVHIGPEILQEYDRQVKVIKERLKESLDRQKSYENAKRTPREFEIWDKVFLCVKPQKSLIKFGKESKFSP